MVIIGSYAAKLWFPDFRQPDDIDVILTFNELKTWHTKHQDRLAYFNPSKHLGKYRAGLNGTKIEFHMVDPNSNSADAKIYNMTKLDSVGAVVSELGDEYCKIADPDVLFALKSGHIVCPHRAWDKHIADYTYLKAKVGDLPAYLMPVVAAIRFEARTRAKPKLNVTNEEFFKNSQGMVGRLYDHDSVHQAVAYYDKPLCTKIKSDQAKAACDKSLFLALNYQDQLRCVREEGYVIALERYLIDNPKLDVREAFKRSLGKICTTLCSGWFRQFAIDNYNQILNYDKDYYQAFLNGLDSGIVRPYESAT